MILQTAKQWLKSNTAAALIWVNAKTTQVGNWAQKTAKNIGNWMLADVIVGWISDNLKDVIDVCITALHLK
ncbi:hypothetical protein ACLI09_09510 [Flavobacterium sp. RHBU_24]|uniref:hypothetical protein n=1 Tax=Flavobacterium sp. RHBU_24 TaxID=3391185 RepID=UPI00398515D4